MGKKTGGSLRITYEMMKDILGLPGQTIVTNISGDDTRDIMRVKYLFPGEVRGFSYQLGEGQQYPEADASDFLMKRMIRFARQYEKLHLAETREGAWIRALEEEIIKEEEQNAEVRK